MKNILCRLLLDPPAAGDWNMAVDEVLLEDAAEHGLTTLRFYGWSEPTLSLGYFQRHDDRTTHPYSAACPEVRRVTGGGAIIHDRELTYSFCLPVCASARRNRAWLYTAFHETLAEALSHWEITAHLHEASSGRSRGAEPFLCFERRSAGDLVIGDLKVAGSAQRSRKGAVLQHGSVLLETSTAAPELPGIAHLCGQSIAPANLIETWKDHLAARLNMYPEASRLSEASIERATRMATEKFASSTWTLRR